MRVLRHIFAYTVLNEYAYRNIVKISYYDRMSVKKKECDEVARILKIC